MKEFTLERAKELLGDMVCSYDVQCVKHGLEQMCNAKDIGDKSYLVCLEEDTQCSFSTLSNDDDPAWCTCPVRMFVKREYNL